MLLDPNQGLDVTHHDAPERHIIGRTLLAPTTVKADAAIGTVGVSDAPAREDHVHGAGDTWHIVGDAGEPAFQNSWTNFAGGYQSLRFRKEGGRVFIEAVIKNGNPANAVAFILPAGYRPIAFRQWPARFQNTVDTVGTVDVSPTGDVKPSPLTGTGNPNAVSFGIDFAVD